MSQPIRVLIVDDDQPAQSLLASFLRDHPDMAALSPCGTVREAVVAIRRDNPDLVLLDIQLGRETGFDVIAQVGTETMPVVVFATAYDQHAVAAFEAQALDYLLKPLDRGRFAQMLDRVRHRLRTEAGARRAASYAQLVQELAGGVARRIPLQQADRTVMLVPREIDRIEADDNYVRVTKGRTTYVARESLSALLSRLPDGQFVRVNRSVAVNIERVRQVEPWFRGEYVLILDDGSRFTTGRVHRQAVIEALLLR